MEFIIGIDNAKTSHFATVINNNGEVHTKFQLENNIDGYLKLNAYFAQSPT